MNTATAPSFASIQLGAPQVHRNIVVFPITSPSHGVAHWLTLGEALEQQFLTVTEVSHGGSVPELAVINRADRPVLLLDGEELIGAKQNRVLNTTILLKERSETVVPVSCTEHGRWSYVSAAFADAKLVMAHRVRARKSRSVSESLAASAGFTSDLGEVWNEIAALHSSVGTSSPTGAMHDAFKARERELEQCLSAFSAVPVQTGLLVVIDDQIAGFDLVPLPEIYARQHVKLVKSYVIDSIGNPDPRPANPDAAGARAAEFLRAAAECPVRKFPSIGYGTDCRYQSPGLAGAALIYEDRVVHAAFFSLAPEARREGDSMASLRVRRRRFTE
jgi:hypothetical protein